MAVAPVFYSLSPYGTGDIKTCQDNDCVTYPLTLTISGGVATLSYAQTGNIGVGCDIDFDDPSVNVYIAPNRLGFDSGGTTELKTGDKIEGGTSSATGIIRAIEITSGSWAGGDAAGYLYFSTTSGTWQDNEQINRTKPSSSSNIATVDGTLQGNLGNGDTQFVVKKATGADADAVGSAETVNSIHHEWASLSAYEANFTDANHINNADLTASGANVVVYGCCYRDHDDSTTDIGVTLDWTGTTDTSHYLQFFTPLGGSESILDGHRHDGKELTTAYRNVLSAHFCYNYEEHIIFEGLQIMIASAGANRYFYRSLGTAGVNEFKSCIIGVDGSGGGQYRGFYETIAGDVLKISNIVVYAEAVGTHMATWRTGGTIYLYNSILSTLNQAVNDTTSGTVIKNCIINNCTDFRNSALAAGSTHNVIDITGVEGCSGTQADSGNCDGIGTDANKLRDTGQNFTSTVQVGCYVANTTDTTYSYVTAVDSDTELTLNDDIMDDGEDYVIYTNMYGSVTFDDEANDDYHLDSADTVAIDKGTDLSTDANLPIWDDFDADARGATWDVGADEYVAVGAVAPTGVLQGPLVGPFGGPI